MLHTSQVAPRKAPSGKSRLSILLLSDEIGGHVNQARGLVAWLRERYDLSVQELVVRFRFQPLGKSLLPHIVMRTHSPLHWFHRFYLCPSLPESGPDLIISAGGKTAFANVLLARHYGCKNVFLGSKRKLPGAAFSAHLTLEPSGDENNLVMGITPSVVVREKMQEAAKSFAQNHELGSSPKWVLLVGGDGAGFRYQAAQWVVLANWMNALSKANGVHWLVTTSRRTSPEGEAILRQHLNPEALAYGAWWHQKEERVVQAFLGLADAVVVTADSMTMVTEAIGSELPAIVLSVAKGEPDERYQSALRKFVDQGLCEWLVLKDGQPLEEQIRYLSLPKGGALSPLREALLDQLASLLALP